MCIYIYLNLLLLLQHALIYTRYIRVAIEAFVFTPLYLSVFLFELWLLSGILGSCCSSGLRLRLRLQQQQQGHQQQQYQPVGGS